MLGIEAAFKGTGVFSFLEISAAGSSSCAIGMKESGQAERAAPELPNKQSSSE